MGLGGGSPREEATLLAQECLLQDSGRPRKAGSMFPDQFFPWNHLMPLKKLIDLIFLEKFQVTEKWSGKYREFPQSLSLPHSFPYFNISPLCGTFVPHDKPISIGALLLTEVQLYSLLVSALYGFGQMYDDTYLLAQCHTVSPPKTPPRCSSLFMSPQQPRPLLIFGLSLSFPNLLPCSPSTLLLFLPALA